MKKCKKIIFPSEVEALKKLVEFNENNGDNNLKTVYECKRCKGWHLSSMSKKRFDKWQKIFKPTKKDKLQKTGLATKKNWIMSESKAYLEATYKLPVFVTWDKVPRGMFTKTSLKEQEKWDEDLQPCGIKGGGMNPKWYFLYMAKEEITHLKPE